MNTLTNILNDLAAGDPLTTKDGVVLLVTGLLAVAAVASVGWMLHRAARSVARSNLSRDWTGRKVLIVVAVVVAFAVAGIGGTQSFRAVSDKFGSALVPLVADGMVIACTALRLAALTRGWRIPGALFTTYLFIGGTVVLNIDAANGAVDVAIAHALAPLAYAVLVEMLAHMLRLHLKLSQPARPKLSALTWITSPVITTRVWLHLARTGNDDPIQARALVQQVVRMSSRLNTVCPSRRTLPLDSARAARTAALQTIRDGLLTAGQLAALLPTTERISAGELLALVDSAALGLPVADNGAAGHESPAEVPAWLVLYLLAVARRDQIRPAKTAHSDMGLADTGEIDEEPDEEPDEASTVLPLIVGYVFGALHHQNTQRTDRSAEVGQFGSAGAPPLPNGAPALHHGIRTGAAASERSHSASSAAAPVHHPAPAPAAARNGGASVISASFAEPAQSSPANGAGSGETSRAKQSDKRDLAELFEVSAREHGGAPLSQREITRVLDCGFSKARRLAELAGWVEPKHDDTSDVANPAAYDQAETATTDANSNNPDTQQANEADELEMSNH
ncbi:DUF2637 domain-containing protein [Kribbella jiaozuonensis]|uniref:DUF2637 domain-containing protein n=1 Tax=Kribbella jiaozuonensis TaxID=2575441 RepID=A0A4U3LT24_9ACTN|nr:DUF2637 domain-containing protein [Kribbella jiaozuonensis]TKK79165.1 hypothetical protein FDA38_12090 [Kribbella jiaozuonensis]TKK83235.1 hypothetical protein FDA38_11045 [Kribbella jiaozuonensis]